LDNKGIQTAGDVNIEECVIITPEGREVDIRQYIGELNVYEDMFRPGMYGNVLMIDAGNLAAKLPIIGEEYIRMKITTPSLKSSIHKQFKVYKVSDKRMLSDTNKQSYIVHFISTEVFLDLSQPVWGAFGGQEQPAGGIADNIYNQYLATPRLGEGSAPTKLIQIGAAASKLQFISPGWSAVHCMQFVASKAMALGRKSPSFLFWESNKAWYFANIEALIDNTIKSGGIFCDYIYMANNLSGSRSSGAQPEGSTVEVPYSKDIDQEFKKVEDFEVIESFNYLKNMQNGYFANRLMTVDLLEKDFKISNYTHTDRYNDYVHLENIGGLTDVAPFRPDTLTGQYLQVYPQHKKMLVETAGETDSAMLPHYGIEEVMPRRVSVVQELSNFKIVLTVPGRTDNEVGNIIYFSYPDSSPRDQTDKAGEFEDAYYSGYYLVTAIRHKITLQKHMMIMEAVKDSYRKGKI
jgi:hypothetical protein